MGLFDLSGAVALLASHTVSVKRPNVSTYTTAGIAQAQSFATYPGIRASVQPVKGEDLKKGPDGVSDSELISLHSRFEFFVGDRVTVPARGDFEVFHCDEWAENGNYSKALARLLDENEPRA